MSAGPSLPPGKTSLLQKTGLFLTSRIFYRVSHICKKHDPYIQRISLVSNFSHISTQFSTNPECDFLRCQFLNVTISQVVMNMLVGHQPETYRIYATLRLLQGERTVKIRLSVAPHTTKLEFLKRKEKYI